MELSPQKGTNHFQKNRRILKSFEFEVVFNKNQLRASNQNLLVLALEQTAQRDGRIGLVVGKRNLSLAVTRNRVKRITREVFRGKADNELKNLDILLVARKGLDKLSNQDIREQLQQLFIKINKQTNKRNAAKHEQAS